MIDQLFNLIKEHAGNAIVNNPEVPNEMNEQAMEVAHNSLVDGLRGFSSEDLAQLQQSVNQDNIDPNSTQMGFLSNNMVEGLTQKLGLNSGIAKTIVVALLPILLKKIFSGSKSEANTQNAGFNMNDILGSILGGGAAQTSAGGGGLMDKLSNLGKSMGMDKDGDGDVDLNDIAGMFKK